MATKKKKSASHKGTAIVTKISRHAKKIRKSGESWPKAISRASKELKKSGSI